MEHVSHRHGGDLKRAQNLYGGASEDWLDLSTGINPVPYPIGEMPMSVWTALPDAPAFDAVVEAARTFWNVPDHLEIVVAPGASALIAAIPRVLPGHSVKILAPTYTEHATAFEICGWTTEQGAADVVVGVHPNNPDGLLRTEHDFQDAQIAVVDESFADIGVHSLVGRDGPTIALKSFGKFWGLAGLRLGFAICAPAHADALRKLLGPWSASGPALHIAARALTDDQWTRETRARLKSDALRLDQIFCQAGAAVVGGTSLFRLYDVTEAHAWQAGLSRHQIWTRTFDYAPTWLRVGLPPPREAFARLEAALA